MTIPESSKYLIEQGAVNYSDPLAEYYSKRAQQMEQHLQDSIAARNKKAKIAADESFVNVLQGIAQFSSAARSAVDAHKARKEKKDTKDKKDLGNRLSRNTFWREHRGDLIEYEYLKKKTGFDPNNYDKEKQKLDNNSDEKRLVELAKLFNEHGDQAAAEEVLNASGRRLRLQNELLVENAGSGLSENRMVQYWERIDSPKLDEWADAEKNGNRRTAMFIEWQNEQIAHLNLKPETVGALLGKEFNRQRSTVSNLQHARISSSIAKEKDLSHLTTIETALASGNLERGVWQLREKLVAEGTFKSIEGGLTANQQVDAYIADVLGRLAIDGDINTSQLEPYINLGIKHPAGTTVGTTILSKEQVADLVTKARIGEGRRLSVLTSRDISGLEEARQLKIKGDAESDAKADAILAGLSVRGLVPKEKIQAVSDMSMADNTPQAYLKEKATWEFRLESGNIVDFEAEANDIKNDQLRDEVQAKIKLHKKVRKNLTYDERWIDLKVAQGLNLTLKEGEVLDQRGLKVRNDLLHVFRKNFQERIEANPKDSNALNDAIDFVEAYWDRNGGNVKKGEKGEGRFSPTSGGRYDNYDTYSGLKSDRQDHALAGSDANNVRTWQSRVNDAVKIAINDKSFNGPITEKVLNTPLSILDAEDIMGAFENRVFSQELVLKARQLGVSPYKLLISQTEALEKSDQKDLLRNLDQNQRNNFPNSSELLYEAIERAGDTDLLYLLNRKGAENLTSNQLLRIETAVNVGVQTRKTIKEENQTRARIKKNTTLRNNLSPSEYFGTEINPEGDDSLPDKKSVEEEGYTGF